MKLDDPKSPDNVNWYKVTEDGDELLDDTDTIAIERAKGKHAFIKDDSSAFKDEKWRRKQISCYAKYNFTLVDMHHSLCAYVQLYHCC